MTDRRRFDDWRRRRFERQITRARLDLRDEEHYFDLWGNHPGYKPSERDRMKARLDRKRVVLDELERRLES